MTTEEETQLRELSEGLTTVARSPWEPACIARAFASAGIASIDFTMQAWIDLEHLRSPLLQDELPATLEELEASLNCLGLSAEGLDADEALSLGRSAIEGISGAFAMALSMRDPRADTESAKVDGFGTWLLIFTCLKTQCDFSAAEARALHVGQAYAILAAHRCNQGWEPQGATYAQRDVAGLNEPGGQPSDPGSMTPATATTEDAPHV